MLYFTEKIEMTEAPPAEDANGQPIPVEPVVEEKDEDEKELEKLEKGDPEMIKICNTIMSQLDDFKVTFNISKAS